MKPGRAHATAARQRDSSESYGKVAKVGAVWAFAREGVTQLIGIPAAIILARLLSPEEFGIAAAATFFIQLANRLTTLGLNAALVRITTLRPEHASSVFALNLAMGIIVCVSLIAIAPAVGTFYRSPESGSILPVAALTFVVIPFGAVPVALLNRNMRFREVAVVNWVAAVTFAVGAPLLAWRGYSYWSLVYAQLAANVAQSLAKLYLSKWSPSLRFSVAALKEVFPFGAGVYAKRLLDYAAQNLDSLVVGRVLGMTALGFYDKAFNTMDRFVTRFAVGPGVSFRIFAIIQEDPERFRSAYHRVMLSVGLVALPVFSGLFMTAREFIVVLFGEKWLPSVPVFQALCAVGALKLVNTYAGSATQALGLIWAEVWRQVLYAAAIVIGILLGSRWGIVGAAWGVLGANLVMTCLMQMLMRRVTGLRFPILFRPFVPGILCSLGLIATIGMARTAMQTSTETIPEWVSLLIQSAAGAAWYMVYLLASRSADVRCLVTEFVADLAPSLTKYLPRRTTVAPRALALGVTKLGTRSETER